MTKSNSEHFGEHFTIDGYNGNPLFLNDKNVIFSVLNDLPNILGMHPLSTPIVLEAPDNQIKDPGGFSGFVIIAESHISLHTFPKRKFISADVYTCRNGLDTGLVSEYFKKTFELENMEVNYIKRGLNYPSQNLIN